MTVKTKSQIAGIYDEHHRRFMHKAPTSKLPTLNVRPELSVYYWWWVYLRKNEEYRKCCENDGKEKLSRFYKDFGNVFNTNYHDWWFTNERGEYLFAEPLEPIRLHELNSVADWNRDWKADTVVVVAVPITVAKRLLKRRFAQLLQRRHKGKPGKPAKEKSEAIYKVNPKFSIHALEQMMKVYELRQAKPELTLAQIGQMLNLNPSAMPKISDKKKELADKKNTMSAAVSRYLKKSTAIIKNATDKDKPFPCADK